MPRGLRDTAMRRRRAAASATTAPALQTPKPAPASPPLAAATPATTPILQLNRRATDTSDDAACPVRCGNTAVCCPAGNTCLFTPDGHPICQNSAIANLNNFLNDASPTSTATFDHHSYLSAARPSLQPSYYTSLLSSLNAAPTPPPAAAFTKTVDAHARTPPDAAAPYAAIAGGAIGGTVALAAVVLGVWMMLRHKKAVVKNSTIASSRATGKLSMPGIEGGAGFRPLPEPPAVELAGRPSAPVEMEGDSGFRREPVVWHELEAGPVGK